ncbi:MAG TPA: hypothetical protein VN962_28235 [Polyangia bacterium]|nr:hypothetical protein [Polyangia bacterium]
MPAAPAATFEFPEVRQPVAQAAPRYMPLLDGVRGLGILCCCSMTQPLRDRRLKALLIGKGV